MSDMAYFIFLIMIASICIFVAVVLSFRSMYWRRKIKKSIERETLL